MQLATVEFARNVIGLEGAHSAELDPNTPYPIIDLLPEQKDIEDLGGTDINLSVMYHLNLLYPFVLEVNQ